MILVATLKRFLQILDGFWKDSAGILGGFWKDNKLLEAFQVAEFILRIRATRGRSTDGRMEKY